MIPMFLGGVMNSTGNKPPATLPAKAKFMMGDLQRSVGLFGTPNMLGSPNNFFTEVAMDIRLVQRFLVAYQIIEKSEGKNSSKKFISLALELGKGIHEDSKLRTADDDLKINEDFIRTCAKRAGLNDDEIKKAWELSQTKEVKDKLVANTNEAVELGAFGSPTMIVHGGKKGFEEPFMVFGSDRFEQIAYACDLPYPGLASKL